MKNNRCNCIQKNGLSWYSAHPEELAPTVILTHPFNTSRRLKTLKCIFSRSFARKFANRNYSAPRKLIPRRWTWEPLHCREWAWKMKEQKEEEKEREGLVPWCTEETKSRHHVAGSIPTVTPYNTLTMTEICI